MTVAFCSGIARRLDPTGCTRPDGKAAGVPTPPFSDHVIEKRRSEN